MGRERAGRSQKQAPVQRMGVGGRGAELVRRQEEAPGVPSFWLPFAPPVQVDPGLGSMQAACPASLLRIGWKEP
jgi:hypothetical protein